MGWALDVVYQTLDQPLTSASLDVEFALSSRQALPPTAAGPQGAAPLPLLIELDACGRCSSGWVTPPSWRIRLSSSAMNSFSESER